MPIGGASMAAEIFEFLVAPGIDARMLYGMMECLPTAMHMTGDIDFDTSEPLRLAPKSALRSLARYSRGGRNVCSITTIILKPPPR